MARRERGSGVPWKHAGARLKPQKPPEKAGRRVPKPEKERPPASRRTAPPEPPTKTRADHDCVIYAG